MTPSTIQTKVRSLVVKNEENPMSNIRVSFLNKSRVCGIKLEDVPPLLSIHNIWE